MIIDENSRHENPIVSLSDREILIGIWTSPRLVFRYLEDNRYDRYTYVFLFLGALVRSIEIAEEKKLGSYSSLITLLGWCVLGGFMWCLFYYIYAATMSWMGGWIKGEANTESFVRMLSYALVPLVTSLIFSALEVAVFGVKMFQSTFEISDLSFTLQLFFYCALLMKVLLATWSVVLFVIGISEIQKFSILKSILNMIIPGLSMLTVTMIIVLILDLFK
jgi:hypothetical protein